MSQRVIDAALAILAVFLVLSLAAGIGVVLSWVGQ